MLSNYYQNELNSLRNLADEFARRNPALAPMLGAEKASDPDVERLLEGVAFLTSIIHQRLDNEFPEFIQTLTHLLYPQFLKPIPCMSVLQFKSRSVLQSVVQIEKGCEVASVPVEGYRIPFRTVLPVALEPVDITKIYWDKDNIQQKQMVVELKFSQPDINAWEADALQFFLGDGQVEACLLLRLLSLNLKEIVFESENAPSKRLGPQHLKHLGFDNSFSLLPCSDESFPAYRQLLEYFTFPEKFLFLELNGIKEWTKRGTCSTFNIRFIFDTIPAWAPELTGNSLMLGVTPVVNVYKQGAHPLYIDHTQSEYRIQPPGLGKGYHAWIYSVLNVTRLMSDGSEKKLLPFNVFSEDESYNLNIQPSIVNSREYDIYLGLMNFEDDLSPSTLSIDLLCTNGTLPEVLNQGDINLPMDNTPSRVVFKNIRLVSNCQQPKYDTHLLWTVLSQINANHFRLLDSDYLRNLLKLYVPYSKKDKTGASHQHIESIEKIESYQERRFVRGLPIDGTIIKLFCNGDNFVNAGDLYLFGCILDSLFSNCAAVNSFVELVIYNTLSSEVIIWPAKFGNQQLL